ncbi:MULTISPECIES: STAS domain-containing protein [unclassified Shimia]|uniref:STAS domain-containing protein n=1 Tax=unclassified Shimia TaxID=2630038 RepID=UPI001ADC25D4|nr:MULTISPECIES: STAS domain-containing protein [unclassified Shimia]MBO9474378.1 STAS domain-containing protein [Shimia sp. R10_1]MDA5557078.1 STAS domain-containing protein [Shimia sp. MMG029]
MNLSSKTEGGALVVSVHETRIDASVAIQFKDRMREETEQATGRVILDLSEVDFIDSSGLGAIVAAMKQLGGENRLELSGLNENVDKVFRLTRMDTVFRIHETLDEAFVE